MNVVFDVAVHPIDQSGEKRAENESEQHPVLDDDVGRQYEEIETDVLAVERVVRTKGHAVEKMQEDVPIADFYRGNQQSNQACRACDNPRPWQPIAHKRQQIGRWHIARGLPDEVGDGLGWRPPGETHREPSVQPEDDGSRRPDGKKDDGFSANCCPENLQIPDRGKPQPIDQEVAREPEQYQENSDDDGGNDEPDQGASPWCLPAGSGDPDRHSLIIAETRDTYRFIRNRENAVRQTAFERDGRRPGAVRSVRAGAVRQRSPAGPPGSRPPPMGRLSGTAQTGAIPTGRFREGVPSP